MFFVYILLSLIDLNAKSNNTNSIQASIRALWITDPSKRHGSKYAAKPSKQNRRKVDLNAVYFNHL